MPNYTKEEKIEMLKWHHMGNSFQQVCDLFGVKYPNRPIPNKTTILRLKNKFDETGGIYNKRKSYPSRKISENTSQLVCASVENEPKLSSNRIATDFGISRSSVQRILKTNGYKSYKISKHQVLFHGDTFRRMHFCETMLEKIHADNDFLNHILFTDESSFREVGEHNPSVVRYWSQINEHRSVASNTQVRHNLNVWAGLLGDHIIGPFFIDGTLNSEKYLQLLQNQVLPYIQEIPNININRIYFQQDGCPAHNSLAAKNFLSQQFPNRWIGTASETLSWPPRSADLSPLDFFYWGYLKESIYQHEIQTLEEVRYKIIEISNSITPETLSAVRNHFYNRLGYCLAKYGDIFEPFI